MPTWNSLDADIFADIDARVPPGSNAIVQGYIDAHVAVPINVQTIPKPSRKLNVTFTDVSRFAWDAPNVGGYWSMESGLLRATTLLDYAPPRAIILPKNKKLLLCAPKLVLDEVTRYLSWEHMTWEQKLIDETERYMTRPTGWTMWEEDGGFAIDPKAVDKALGFDRTIFQQLFMGVPVPGASMELPNSNEVGDKNSGGPAWQTMKRSKT